MSTLKRDIEKVWDILGYWKTGKIHIKWWFDEDGCRVDCTDEIAEATTQIINLVESVIPEEKSMPYNPEFQQQANSARVEGYNQAIKDIKSKLIGKE